MSEVYVLSNIAMPGMVKVGHSYSAEARARQLSAATGVPCEFEVAYAQETDVPADCEAIAHELLSDLRVNARREFFYTKSATAAKAVQTAALLALWNRASSEARQEFLGRIDSPLMDKRWA